MKSLRKYINEKLIIKQKTTPTNKQELIDAILDHFNISDGDLNDIDVSILKEKDFYRLFQYLRKDIKKNNITEIDISDWQLKESYYDETKGIGMFDDCKTLETIILPECLEAIGDFTFYKCRKLNNIIIPDSVTKISHWAFSACIGLTSVTIPNSVTVIGIGAFDGCPNLTIIVLNEQVKRVVESSGFHGKIIIKNNSI